MTSDAFVPSRNFNINRRGLLKLMKLDDYIRIGQGLFECRLDSE